MPPVAGERATAALAAMPHLGIAERRLAPLGDAAQNAPAAGGRTGLDILRYDHLQCGQRLLQRRGRLGRGRSYVIHSLARR